MSSIQNVKGVNQTKYDAGGLANMVASGLKDGRIKVCSDYYTADGSEALGSTIQFGGNLPAGAKIIAILLSSSVAQTSVTVQVGTTYNADEFISTGNSTLQTAEAVLVANGKGYVVGTSATDDQIEVLTEGADLQAGTIYCQILYTTD